MNQNKSVASVVPVDMAGVVTLSEPLMMADGVEYRYIWAREWLEVPVAEKKEVETKPADGQFEYATLVNGQFCGLVAMDRKFIEVIVPWEMVIGWARCEKVPERTDIYLCVKAGDDSY